MDLRKRFATDPELELNGVWVEIGQGARVKVARTNNKRYTERMQALMRPHRRQLRMGQLDDEVFDAILIRVVAETVLLDWENLEDGGKPIPYNTENAMRLMTEFPDFRNVVAEIAQEMETFRAVELADAEKNSERSSSGS